MSPGEAWHFRGSCWHSGFVKAWPGGVSGRPAELALCAKAYLVCQAIGSGLGLHGMHIDTRKWKCSAAGKELRVAALVLSGGEQSGRRRGHWSVGAKDSTEGASDVHPRNWACFS